MLCLSFNMNLIKDFNNNVCFIMVSKAVVCSLFNAKSAELKGKPLLAEKFDDGAMRDTPSCLTKYEVEMLNAMYDD